MNSASILALLLCCLAGCGSEKRPANELNTNVAEAQHVTPAVKKTPTASVTPTPADTATSPAATDLLPPEDADPAFVCRRFMELLQSGNRISAENLLTRSALTMTSKAGLKLEPMGGPTSRYEMGAIRYATIKNELAQVDCVVVDQIEGSEVRSPVTWLVRRQNLGWRISGLIVQLDTNQPLNLLSFESLPDVEEIKRRATDAIPAILESESRQASAKTEAVPLK